MQTIRWSTRSAPLVILVAVLLGVAACASAAAPSPTPTASSPASGGAPIGSPDSNPNDSAGVTNPKPAHGNPNPVVPDRTLVAPVPGQLDVTPIPAESLSASIDGRRAVVAIDYVTGVEPCYVLDSIIVQRGPGSFAITLRQGHGPELVMCIEIAESRRTLVDLGDLQPGSYVISDAVGGAAPITITID